MVDIGKFILFVEDAMSALTKVYLLGVLELEKETGPAGKTSRELDDPDASGPETTQVM